MKESKAKKAEPEIKDDAVSELSPGELVKFMKDLKQESMDMMDKLTQMDSLLVKVKDQLAMGKKLPISQVAQEIDDIRSMIGNLEREDEIELNEEELADSLLGKLRKWVDQLV